MDAKQKQTRDCQACDKGKQATHECVECAQALCLACKGSHSSSAGDSSNKPHTLRPLPSHVLALKASGDVSCHLHITQPCMLFCIPCETTICVACKLTTHAAHETEDLMDTGKKARAELARELGALEKRELTLRAALAKSQDFAQDVERERQGVEEKMQERAQELRQLVERGLQEAMESCEVTAQKVLREVKELAAPLEQRHALVDSRLKTVRKVIQQEEGADSQAVALLAQIKEEKGAGRGGGPGGRHPGPGTERVLIERGTVKYEYRARAVKYTSVLAFIGSATEGHVIEARASSSSSPSSSGSTSTEGAPENLLELSARPPSSSSSSSELLFSEASLAFRRGKVTQASGRTAPVEVHYSKNPKATLLAMHLLSADDDFWLCFNPGGSVTLFGLFDVDGHLKESHSENIPTWTMLLTCDGDTMLSMTNGRWLRPGKEAGGVEGFANWGGVAVSKSSKPYLLKQSAIYRQLTDDLPPKVDTKVAFTAPSGVTMTAFDVSEEGSFVAGIVGGTGVKVFDVPRANNTGALRSYADYAEKDGSAPGDVCFCVMDGKEVLLVAYPTLGSVHVLDHRDGCCFVRTLQAEDQALAQPCRLATNHHGRVWVGCYGGKVVIFDV